jgi:hypothetical protein
MLNQQGISVVGDLQVRQHVRSVPLLQCGTTLAQFPKSMSTNRAHDNIRLHLRGNLRSPELCDSLYQTYPAQH